jgi:hypothetical protein
MYDIDPRRQQRQRILFAAVLGGAGLGAIALLFFVSSFPNPFWLWAIFAAAFVALEWNAVEGSEEGESHKRSSWVFHWLVAFSSTIAAGSKDIQRNIIGDRILGLPR